MISLPVLPRLPSDFEDYTTPEVKATSERSAAARARAAARRKDEEEFNKALYYRFQVVKARMEAHGLTIGCYLGPTMLAMSRLEAWLGKPNEANILRHYAQEIHKPHVAAALANPFVVESTSAEQIQKFPPIRLRFEEASAFGSLGECMDATKSKSWGKLVSVDPIDEGAPMTTNVLYTFHASSRYNRRFEQRKYLKRKLGKLFRKLVNVAMSQTKTEFTASTDAASATAIRTKLGMTTGEFWRAVKGNQIERPAEYVQANLFE